MNSTKLIKKANDAYKKLEHKEYDRVSFINGYYVGRTKALTEHDNDIKQLIDDMIEKNNRDKAGAYIENDNYDVVACVNRNLALTELKSKI